MKTLRIIALAALTAVFSTGLRAQQAVLPFTGTVQYSIAYESPIIPQEQLAQQPQIASLRMAADKAVFSMAEQKALADATTKEVHSLINLSSMGLGKYHMVETEAELQQQMQEMQNVKVEETEETKTIFGYTAKLTKAAYKEGNTSVEMEIWTVENFCDPFLSRATQGEVPGLKGFPLEYKVKTPDMTVNFTVRKLTNEEVNPKYFSIPSSYKASTKEQMQKDIQEFMQSMQNMQGGMGM
ncbi:MAG: hypothetical protein NC324_07085 [Bacteroides sp.]|nr:hypothetical protein [Bacteroides sp.]